MPTRFRNLLDEAEWSDRFFNFDDAADAYEEGKDTDKVLTSAVASFLRLHPECPADAAWLVADFKRRV